MERIPIVTEPLSNKSEWDSYLFKSASKMSQIARDENIFDPWSSDTLHRWLKQPHCQSCFVNVDLVACHLCNGVAHCKNKHCVDMFTAIHTPEVCELHCTRLAAYVMALQQGNYLKVPTKNRNPIGFTMPPSIMEYIESKKHDYEVPYQLIEMVPVKAMLSDTMSSILTVIYCLQTYVFKPALQSGTTNTNDSLCIHFIGADAYDALGAGFAFEEFLHCLPNYTNISIYLIGPDMAKLNYDQTPACFSDMSNQNLCAACKAKRCHISIYFVTTTYHEAVANNALGSTKPDIAIAANSGLHDYHLYESWTPTIQYLYRNAIQTIFTSYNEMEINNDYESIQQMVECDVENENVDVTTNLLPPQRNPYRGHLPLLEFNDDNLFFYNCDYYTMLLFNDS
jgi:hypothetical protein